MNERFIFISSVAFSIVCGWLFVKHGWTSTQPAIRYGALALLVGLLGAYAFKTYVRIPAWKDALSLNSQAVLVSENSARSNCFMATALYEVGRDTSDAVEKQRLFEEAEFYADRSLAIYPSYLSANQIKSGLVAERFQRDHDLNKLLQEYEVIIRAKPQTEYVRQFLEYLNGRADHETMVAFYYRVGYEIVSKELGMHAWAVPYLKLGEAIAPNDPRILFGLGKALFIGGDEIQGQQYLDRAYAINPALRTVD
jgi:tetratricopeptide (TPR) repeat protein